MFKDKTIVYTSGTFDMFHYNHLRMINYARSLADILLVGVSTDELVSSYKAKPIIPFHERLQIIEALKMCIRDRYHPVSGLQVLIPAIFFDFEVRGREELEKFTSGIRQGRLGLFYTAKSGRCSAKFGYGYGG